MNNPFHAILFICDSWNPEITASFIRDRAFMCLLWGAIIINGKDALSCRCKMGKISFVSSEKKYIYKETEFMLEFKKKGLTRVRLMKIGRELSILNLLCEISVYIYYYPL